VLFENIDFVIENDDLYQHLRFISNCREKYLMGYEKLRFFE